MAPLSASRAHVHNQTPVAHRMQTRRDVAEVDLRLQWASQSVAEELVGVRSDLRYGTEQVRHLSKPLLTPILHHLRRLLFWA